MQMFIIGFFTGIAIQTVVLSFLISRGGNE
jgi:hypothetical protein